MDTGTHIAMGIGLGGLAYLQPEVAAQPELAQAVMICTVLGSNAPDADGIFRLKNYASYVQNHRGLSHSWPTLILWSLLISTLSYFLVDAGHWLTLFFWTSMALFLHVLVDVYNTYGTQALRPFSNKWVAFNVIHIFDPFIFSLFILGVIIWVAGYHPGYTFAVVYLIVFFYYLWRIYAHHATYNDVQKEYPKAKVYVLPTFFWNTWHVIIETNSSFYIRKRKKNRFELMDHFKKKSTDSPIYQAVCNDHNVQAFISFSTLYHWEEEKTSYGYEVTFFDLRFQTKNNYPFLASVQLNNNLEIIDSFIGWKYKKSPIKYQESHSLK